MLFYSEKLLEKMDKILFFGGIKVVFCLNLEAITQKVSHFLCNLFYHSSKKNKPTNVKLLCVCGLVLSINLFFSVCDHGHDHVHGRGDGRGCTLRVRLLSTLLIRI